MREHSGSQWSFWQIHPFLQEVAVQRQLRATGSHTGVSPPQGGMHSGSQWSFWQVAPTPQESWVHWHWGTPATTTQRGVTLLQTTPAQGSGSSHRPDAVHTVWGGHSPQRPPQPSSPHARSPQRGRHPASTGVPASVGRPPSVEGPASWRPVPPSVEGPASWRPVPPSERG